MRYLLLLPLLACADDPAPTSPPDTDALPDTADTDPAVDTDDTDPPVDTDDTDPPVDTDDTDPPVDTDDTDPPIDTDASTLPSWCRGPTDTGIGGTPEPRTLLAATPALAPALDSVSQFTWRLFEASADDNIVVSPISVAVALAMANEGADGATRAELDALLAVPSDRAGWRDAFADLLADVGGTSQNGGAQVRFANRLFGADGPPWSAPFLATAAGDWDAPFQLAPFATDPTGATDQINGWVSDQTCAMIPSLIPAGTITPQTALVLVNALFAEAEWATPFDPGQTGPATFHLASGATVAPPFMHTEAIVHRAHVDDQEVVKIPLEGGELGFWVLMPDDPAGLPAVEAGLVAGQLEAWTAGAATQPVLLHFPKHDVAEATELRTTLSGLGAPTMFDAIAADFSGMVDDVRPLWVDAVVHQATIQFFEDGLRAAAATAVAVSSDTGGTVEELWIDRPFVWVLRDELTGLILFVGRTADPTAG
jgi:serpin B